VLSRLEAVQLRRDKAARSPKPSSACSRVGGIEPVSALGVLVSISSVGAGAVGVTAICCSTPNCQRRTGTYVGKYQGLRNSGEAVIIEGLCASARRQSLYSEFGPLGAMVSRYAPFFVPSNVSRTCSQIGQRYSPLVPRTRKSDN